MLGICSFPLDRQVESSTNNTEFPAEVNYLATSHRQAEACTRKTYLNRFFHLPQIVKG